MTTRGQFKFPIDPVLDIWGMQSTSSLPLLSGLQWPWVVAPDEVLSMGQIKLFDTKILGK